MRGRESASVWHSGGHVKNGPSLPRGFSRNSKPFLRFCLSALRAVTWMRSLFIYSLSREDWTETLKMDFFFVATCDSRSEFQKQWWKKKHTRVMAWHHFRVADVRGQSFWFPHPFTLASSRSGFSRSLGVASSLLIKSFVRGSSVMP